MADPLALDSDCLLRHDRWLAARQNALSRVEEGESISGDLPSPWAAQLEWTREAINSLPRE